MSAKWTPGIDVAWPQGPNLDWPSIKSAGVEFAICKATHGASPTGIDPTFARNRTECRKAGVSFGAYHWVEPAQDPIEQARKFVRVSGPMEPGDVGHALDVEDDDPTAGRPTVAPEKIIECVTICAREVTRLTGRKPLIYTGKWFSAWRVDSAEVATYPLWHAQYPSMKRDHRPFAEAIRSLPADPAIAAPWLKRGIKESIWQFDGDGGLFLPQGIDVDVNRMRSSLADFIRSTYVSPALSPLHAHDKFALQAALVELGFDLGKTGPNGDGIDGDPGTLTRAALALFQRSVALPATGFTTDETIAALARALALKSSPIVGCDFTLDVPPTPANAQAFIDEIFPPSRPPDAA